MGEWEKARVGDFFELVTGYAFKSKEFKDTGVPVIKRRFKIIGHARA